MDTKDPAFWIEVGKAIPSFFTAGAAVYGAWMAKKGLDKWKIETVGKRKAELAEQTLVAFYEARDVLKLARTTGGNPSREAGESDAQKEMLDAVRAPIERLLAHAELFARLRALAYPFAAHFGEENTKPFHVVIGIHDDIGVSARALISRMKTGKLGEESHSHISIVFGGVDDFDRALDQACADMAKICHQALAAKAK
jgi:hypothetical protein